MLCRSPLAQVVPRQRGIWSCSPNTFPSWSVKTNSHPVTLKKVPHRNRAFYPNVEDGEGRLSQKVQSFLSWWIIYLGSLLSTILCRKRIPPWDQGCGDERAEEILHGRPGVKSWSSLPGTILGSGSRLSLLHIISTTTFYLQTKAKADMSSAHVSSGVSVQNFVSLGEEVGGG